MKSTAVPRAGRPSIISLVLLAGSFWVMEPAATAAQTGAHLAPVREALRQRLEAAGSPPELVVANQAIHAVATLLRFYEGRGYQPAWWEGERINGGARELLEVIRAADEEGLVPADYHLVAFEDLVASPLQPGRATIGRRVDAELLLTDAFLLLGSHFLSGKVDPEAIHSEWIAARRGADLATVLERAISGNAVRRGLMELLPRQPGYQALKAALRLCKERAATGGWAVVSDGPALRPGDRGPRVAALRRRLAATGVLPEEEQPSEVFDAALESAVRGFQARHGLLADGIVGRQTLAELNVPVDVRDDQLIANLERWRWLPESLGQRYVLVNIAGFDLEVVEDGRELLEMRVAVGRDYRRTPVFSDQITYLVLNPSWHIPPKLAIEDVLPQVRKDSAYLGRQGIRVLDGWGSDAGEVDPTAVPWQDLGKGRFPYRLVQQPGPLNSLGRIKFMFPNRFNVYLHDTPAHSVFARDSRAVSSGCIRVEKPLELALYLLRGDQRWSAESLGVALKRGTEQTVRLPEPVPIHLLYWTAWMEDDGQVHFRRDIYSRDPDVLHALREPPPRPGA